MEGDGTGTQAHTPGTTVPSVQDQKRPWSWDTALASPLGCCTQAMWGSPFTRAGLGTSESGFIPTPKGTRQGRMGSGGPQRGLLEAPPARLPQPHTSRRSEPPGMLPNFRRAVFHHTFLLKYKKCKGEIHDWCLEVTKCECEHLIHSTLPLPRVRPVGQGTRERPERSTRLPSKWGCAEHLIEEDRKQKPDSGQRHREPHRTSSYSRPRGVLTYYHPGGENPVRSGPRPRPQCRWGWAGP